MKEKIATLATRLTQHGLKLATAESCTGGGLSYWLTSLPNSSEWFEGGFITYSNASKTVQLGVDPHMIERHGAVSSETARAMAEGALAHSQANISVAITGIAGPGGGTANKPVGLVWFGFAGRDFPTKTTHTLFSGTRETIRQQAIEYALDSLIKIL